MSFENHKRPPIKDLNDLRSYLYWQIGVLSMEEIDAMLELIETYLPLAKSK